MELSIDVRAWVRKTEGVPFVRFVPVDNTISLRSVSLPGNFHADPADRIIAATALTMGLPLITKDEKSVITSMFKQYGQNSNRSVAAIALADNAILVTDNTKHFEYAEGLKLEKWLRG